jgi:hypothetical protein
MPVAWSASGSTLSNGFCEEKPCLRATTRILPSVDSRDHSHEWRNGFACPAKRFRRYDEICSCDSAWKTGWMARAHASWREGPWGRRQILEEGATHCYGGVRAVLSRSGSAAEPTGNHLTIRVLEERRWHATIRESRRFLVNSATSAAGSRSGPQSWAGSRGSGAAVHRLPTWPPRRLPWWPRSRLRRHEWMLVQSRSK